MSNILLDHANWRGWNNVQPAPEWNGSAYEFIGDSGTGKYYGGDTLQYLGDIANGDVVSLSITSTSADATNFSVTVNSSPVFSQSMATNGTYTFTSSALSSGDNVEIIVGGSQGLYSQDAVMTPSGSPPPDPITACKELGRVTRSFVSGYTASRRETRRIRRFSKRCCVADFNGAMETDRTITHVRWDTTSPWSLLMANPRVETGGRKVAIDVSFNFAGWGGLLATATWDNGEITCQEFGFTVLDQPLYPGATYDTANGPYTLEADAT